MGRIVGNGKEVVSRDKSDTESSFLIHFSQFTSFALRKNIKFLGLGGVSEKAKRKRGKKKEMLYGASPLDYLSTVPTLSWNSAV